MILLKANILVLTSHKVSFQLLKPRLSDYQLVNIEDSIVETRKYITQRKPSAVVIFDDISNPQYTSVIDNLLREHIPVIFVYRSYSRMMQHFVGEPFFKSISNQQVFQNIHLTLSLLIEFRRHFSNIEKENKKLKKQLESSKVVNDAKIYLIEHNGMSEDESYRYIQRVAMNERLSKVQAAKKILKDVI